jgi:hypothetical protein
MWDENEDFPESGNDRYFRKIIFRFPIIVNPSGYTDTVISI